VPRTVICTYCADNARRARMWVSVPATYVTFAGDQALRALERRRRVATRTASRQR
jgi:hypothetical protein